MGRGSFREGAQRLGELLLHCIPGELPAKRERLELRYGLCPSTRDARAFWRDLVRALGPEGAAILCLREFFTGRSDPERELEELSASELGALRELAAFLREQRGYALSEEAGLLLREVLRPFEGRRALLKFGDEVRSLGKDLLLLIPGTLRQRRRWIKERLGVELPVGSYARQWKALCHHLKGEVNAALFCLSEFLKGPWDRSDLLRKWSERERLRRLASFVEEYADSPLLHRVERWSVEDHSPASVYSRTLRHDEAKELLSEIGKALGYRVVAELPSPDRLYKYDIAWFKGPSEVPEKIFEVNIKGDVDRALARLKHALDIWRHPRLYLVVRSFRDLIRARRLAMPLLSGTFHELSGNLEIVSAEELRKIPLGTLRALLR